MARAMLGAGLLVLAGVGAMAGEMVGVPGSGTQYPAVVECVVAGKPVKMRLTGTGLRQKFLVNVYAIGSYVQEGVGVKNAEELAGVDCPRRLHLVLERGVEGKDLAEAFRAAVRLNYPEPALNEEVGRLVEVLRGQRAEKGESVYLTHVPGVGLHCYLAGKVDLLIKNPRFSKAVWDIYLGPRNVSETIKKGLVSRL